MVAAIDRAGFAGNWDNLVESAIEDFGKGQDVDIGLFGPELRVDIAMPAVGRCVDEERERLCVRDVAVKCGVQRVRRADFPVASRSLFRADKPLQNFQKLCPPARGNGLSSI